MKGKLLLWNSFLVGAQILTAGAALGEFIGPKLAGLLVLGVAAAQGGTAYYINNQTVSRSEAVPRDEVIATQRTPESPVRATPAAEAAYGMPAGSVVDVQPSSGVPPS